MSDTDAIPHVLILSGVKGDTRRYRSFHPYEQLRLAGVPVQLAHITAPSLPEMVAGSDVVLFQRVVYDGYVERIIRQARRHHSLLLLDVDDLVFDPTMFRWIDSPDFQDPIRRALYQEDMRRNLATLEACDAVTTSTGYLAGEVRKLEKPAWIHRNAFSLEMLEKSEVAYHGQAASRGRVVIGYASGTPTHNRDFALIQPALRRVLVENPQAELWVIGPLEVGEEWGAAANRIRHLPLVPWRDLPGCLAQFDINLAPLRLDNPFSQSKSEIKYMEAALVRVPTVASPTDAFQTTIQTGQNGFLAATAAEWEEAIGLLLQSPQMRRQMGQTAYRDVLARYHPFTRARELVEMLGQIDVQVRGGTQAPSLLFPAVQIPLEARPVRLPSEVETGPSLWKMGVYSLRHRGIKRLLGQAWVFFRRLVAPIFPFRPVE